MKMVEGAERNGANPYESPRGCDEPDVQAGERSRYVWQFALMALPLACASIAMLVNMPPDAFPPAIFVLPALCGPVFLRHFIYRWKRPHARCWKEETGQTSGIAGGVGFALSVLIASGAVGLGTFATTVWIGELAVITGARGTASAVTNESLNWIFIASLVAAVAAGFTNFVWLVRFYYTYDEARS